MGSWTIAIDAGGTFTDAVAVGSGGAMRVTKVPSTPSDPAAALLTAVEELLHTGVPAGEVAAVFHGTTVATNAAIQGRLARVALLCTTGTRDVLSHRDGRRPRLYDMGQPRPSELVRRADRIEVAERLSSTGEVVIPLTDAEVARAADEVAARAPEAVAVALLFSYLDDRHEQRLAAAVRDRLPGTPVTTSADIAREFREYPRTATTVYNAALRPLVGRYLLRAGMGLRALGIDAPFEIMQSNGGSVPAQRADEQAHQLLLSGPTAGVSGAMALRRRTGLDRLISLDMGGTSLDVCLISGPNPPVRATQLIASHPLLSPTVDIEAVGAGGGSIASVDDAGRLRVGPDSAGADPGPVAYGRGGTQVTVTDANVAVGVLGDTPLAGRLQLDADAARDAVDGLGTGLGLDGPAAAQGVIAVAVAHMVRALRRVSVERGLDPSGYTVLAFGGAGPLHASALLKELPLAGVVVPPHPGLFSAAGLVAADQRTDVSRTVLQRLSPDALEGARRWYRDAADELADRLERDGTPPERMRFEGAAECRYLGQGFELTVVVPDPLGGLDDLSDRFHALHEQTYGYAPRQEAIEIVTLRLSAFGAFDHPEPAPIAEGDVEPPVEALVGRRELFHGGEGHKAPVYRRDLLRHRNRFEGPAVVEEMDSTTLVLPGQVADVDREGNLWIREAR